MGEVDMAVTEVVMVDMVDTVWEVMVEAMVDMAVMEVDMAVTEVVMEDMVATDMDEKGEQLNLNLKPLLLPKQKPSPTMDMVDTVWEVMVEAMVDMEDTEVMDTDVNTTNLCAPSFHMDRNGLMTY